MIFQVLMVSTSK